MVAATAAGVHGGGAKGVVIHADGVGCVTDRAWGAADPEQNGMSGGGRRLASGAAKPGVKSRLGGRVEVAGGRGAVTREDARGQRADARTASKTTYKFSRNFILFRSRDSHEVGWWEN